MPLENARGYCLDCRAIGDVARLGFAAELLGQLAQAVGAPREEDAAIAAGGE